MLPVMTTRLLRELGYPAFAFDQINEREEKIIGKKEVKTEYYSESKEIHILLLKKWKGNQ